MHPNSLKLVPADGAALRQLFRKTRQIGLTILAAFATAAYAQTSCLEFDPPTQVGKVADSALTEISGIATSRKTPGVIWAHNDSGDVNRVFALNASGTRLATFYLSGASAIDWEDLAIGPGPIPGQDYLYVADTGNNSFNRATVTIYRVAEPSLAGLTVGAQVNLSGVEALPIQYPNGARDVETLLVDPLTGDGARVARSSHRSLRHFGVEYAC
jgi:hypothetical protein